MHSKDKLLHKIIDWLRPNNCRKLVRQAAHDNRIACQSAIVVLDRVKETPQKKQGRMW